MSDGFYRAFEERLRGSRELIKGRLRAYLPFVEPLLAIYPAVAAVDLGCGRGEWVELLAETGFIPVGVDLDGGMLDACLKLGLPVVQGDAIGYLCALSDESQAVVSAFHVVEHIAFDQLRTLVGEALRVLKPGGLLIMETPNPENIVVATTNFYLDPTHQRPIPPELLAFVAEYSGFARVKTLRLQEATELLRRQDISLHDVMAGASPDYAVVAQKYSSDDIRSLTSNPFEVDYGLTLEDLLGRWDGRFDRLEAKAMEAFATLEQYHSQLIAVYTSTSWRITKPLRWAGDHLRDFSQLPLQKSLKRLMKLGLFRGVQLIGRYPRVKRSAISVATRLGLVDKINRIYSAQAAPLIPYPFLGEKADLVHQSMHVHRIFSDLKAAKAAHHEGHR
jgi:O-antigen chain-terminating methyltransferase